MKDGKLEVGVDTIRDDMTGEVFPVLQVLRPEDLHVFTDGKRNLYKSSNAEKCAMYGSGTQEEREAHRRRMNQSRQRVQAHKGAA